MAPSSRERTFGPDIVGDMYRAARVCTLAAEIAQKTSPLTVTPHDLSLEAVTALARADHGESARVAVDAIVSYLEGIAGRRRGTLSKLARSGELTDALDRAWEDAPDERMQEAATFDEAIIDLSGTIASEDLGWALISLESTRHVKLIWQQANKLAASYPNVDSSDMLSWGWLGLRTALRHYNPNLGFRFSTYACTRITGTIRDGVRSEKPVPKRLGTFARKVSAAEESLTHHLGRAPTLEEVSAHLDVDLSLISLAGRAQPEASIDDIVQSAGASGYTPGWLVDRTDTSEAALMALRSDAVEKALSELDPDEAHAVRLLVMEALHPTEARKATGATARQMRQRKERALRKLKEQLADWA